MNFVQVEFLWFMAITFTAYWAVGRLPRGRVWQNVLLIFASSVFYGWVHPWFLILLFISAHVDFFAAKAIERYPGSKQYILLASVSTQLAILGYFKYFNFFVENVIEIAHALGVHTELRTLAIILPVGISFYTFQTIGYTVDVYRGDIRAQRNYINYLLFVTFFPQLVAGPIERATHLLPQVETPRSFSWGRTLSGISLAAWGAFKKVCLADTIAPYIDKVFIVEDPSGPLVWSAAIAFSVQIYADFSGYTDLARGVARMLGFDLLENFKSPYLAATTPEFWQRWHISLSFWIRDYLMVPLLGAASRLTLFRFVWATILTFVIIGFWHGASWNFILFGFWHGMWMSIYTLAGRFWPERLRRAPLGIFRLDGGGLGRPIAIVFHFFAVSVVGSLLFRERHVDRIFQHLGKPPFLASEEDWIAAAVVIGMTIFCATPMVISHFVERYFLPRVRESVWFFPIQTATWAVLGMCMFIFFRVSASDFIYFQF